MTGLSAPDVRAYVAVCAGCNHWQADTTRHAVTELGGNQPAIMAIAEAHLEHDCPGEGGRVKVLGQWVERPTMNDGEQATALLAFHPFPRWWVAK